MMNKIIISLFICISFLSCVSATQLNYTEEFNTYSTTQISTNQTYSLYTGNSFDVVTIFQNSVFTTGTYYNNFTFYIYNDEYKIENIYVVTNNILPILFNVEHITNVYNNEVLRNSQTEEYTTYKVCTSVFKEKIYFGNYYELEGSDNKIYMEHMVSTWKGSYRYYTYVTDVQQVDMSNIRTIDLEMSLFSGLLVIIDYKKSGLQGESFYTNQLSSPLKWMYKYGLKVIDTDKQILNVMLLTQYILDIAMYIVLLISKSFFTLLIIFLIAGVPTIAFNNSTSQKGFIDKCIMYYVKTFEIMLRFLTYVIKTGLRLIDIINPF